VDVTGMQFVTASASERNKAAMQEFEAEMREEKTPAVRLFSAIIAAATSKQASDVHIEPQPQGTLVRLRVDGVLRELTTIPVEHSSSLVSRIKILSDMDIAERRTPQEGPGIAPHPHRHRMRPSHGTLYELDVREGRDLEVVGPAVRQLDGAFAG
jgi:type II secretory ATPase GspE/PulE/Tfp pilus assembly ATPase PilB-like protein